jgi:hypothetical protein
VTGRLSRFGTVLTLLAAAWLLPSYAADAPTTVSGIVRDARGTPQIGALVELLRPDSTVVASVFTDEHGRFVVGHVLPGLYGVKATGAMFLPTLRENLHVAEHSRTVVNLTLSTLYEAFQWLPAKRRDPEEPNDDWAWTLRSSANRPLLRMLEDGPLVVVSGSDNTDSSLKARVTLHGGASEFGEGGLHHAFEVERSVRDDRRLILRADLSSMDGGALASASALAGYEQQLALGRTMRTVAAIEKRGGILGGSTRQGMEALVLRNAQSLTLTPALELEFGNEFEAVRMDQDQIANHPFAGVTWSDGDHAFSYRTTTALGLARADELDQDASVAPLLTRAHGKLQMEHGLHQEVVFEHNGTNNRVQVVYYRDRVSNPVVNGGGTLSFADLNGGDVIYDPVTGLIQVAGGNYSAQGFQSELKRRVAGDTWLSVRMADGDALSAKQLPASSTLADNLNGLKPHRAQMYAVSVTGHVARAGTHWRGSYRWQSGNTVTAVAPFDSNAPDPYLSLFVRQSLRCGHLLPNGMEALIDIRNLLAQGYRPFITRDGSTLYFAQAERSLRGGLSFTF